MFLRAACSFWRTRLLTFSKSSSNLSLHNPAFSSLYTAAAKAVRWGGFFCMVFLRDGNFHIYICIYVSCGDGLDEIHVIRTGPRTLFSWKSSDLTSVVSSQGEDLVAGLKPRFLIFTTRLSRLISITIINNRELSWKQSKWDARRSNGLSKWCIGLCDLEWIGCGLWPIVLFFLWSFYGSSWGQLTMCTRHAPIARITGNTQPPGISGYPNSRHLMLRSSLHTCMLYVAAHAYNIGKPDIGHSSLSYL